METPKKTARHWGLLEGGAGAGVENKKTTYCAYYLGGKIIRTPSPRDMQFAYITNLNTYS